MTDETKNQEMKDDDTDFQDVVDKPTIPAFSRVGSKSTCTWVLGTYKYFSKYLYLYSSTFKFLPKYLYSYSSTIEKYLKYQVQFQVHQVLFITTTLSIEWKSIKNHELIWIKIWQWLIEIEAFCYVTGKLNHKNNLY